MWYWDPESNHNRNPESRLLVTESGIHGCGIRNPQTWNPESTAWNPESKTLLDYLTWGEKELLRLVFTSDGVVVGVVIRRVERYDLVKIKPTESEAEH